MPTPILPTADSHPFRVGSVVYRDRSDAEAALARASEAYPDAADLVLRFFDGAPVVADRIVAYERDETDACEAGTPGCSIAHHAETLAGSDRGSCETW